MSYLIRERQSVPRATTDELDYVIVLNDRHLKKLLSEYVRSPAKTLADRRISSLEQDLRPRSDITSGDGAS